MTTQDDESGSAHNDARTQLRPAAAEWMLTAKAPDLEEQTFPVRGEMLIGREGCDIPLTSAHASRKHAKLTLSADILRLDDLGSANGTFVNDEKVESAELKPGDEVRFDAHVFVVVGPEPAAPTPAADDDRTALRPAAAPEKKAKKKAGKKSKKKAGSMPQPDSPPAKESAAPPSADATPAKEGSPPPADSAPAKESAPPSPPDSVPAKESAPTPPPDPAPDKEPEPGPQRGAWYERDTPNLTRKVDAGELQDRFAEGGTQIVRGVQGLTTPGLVGTSGDWAGEVVPLEKDSMTIGRSGTDIILDEPSVSTKHAQIVRDGERWKVVDLMSANHVYVNGKKTQVAFLSPGDAVRFGRLEMRFVIDSTQVPSRAAPETDDVIRGSAPSSRRSSSSWLYIAIGFLVVVALGGYILFAS